MSYSKLIEEFVTQKEISNAMKITIVFFNKETEQTNNFGFH